VDLEKIKKEETMENRDIRPTMHRDIPIGTRVRTIKETLPKDVTEELVGEVQGVASVNLFFVYIILLDRPYDLPYFGPCRCMAISGLLLEGEDGESFKN